MQIIVLGYNCIDIPNFTFFIHFLFLDNRVVDYMGDIEIRYSIVKNIYAVTSL